MGWKGCGVSLGVFVVFLGSSVGCCRGTLG